MSEAVLSVRGLAKRYGEREALRGVSFDVGPGELVAVVGPNGAGKTTLLSIIAGVQRAGAGTVGVSARAVGGRHAAGRRPAAGGEQKAGGGRTAGRRRAAGRRQAGVRRIGWVPQQPALYSKLSVQENLRLFARLEGVADPDSAVAAMLAQTELRERAHELVERLSGGNRQRVNVALGLIADPDLLALDEPSAALDPGQRARLWEFLGVLVQSGRSVLFSTHHLGEVRRHATRAIVLADGEVLFDGPPEELVAASGPDGDFEGAFISFLAARGH